MDDILRELASEKITQILPSPLDVQFADDLKVVAEERRQDIA
jgi:hypothetical protein